MRPPSFEELVGPEIESGERERLRRVHALLVEAGPPPEMTPELEAGPTFGTTLGARQRRSRIRRRAMLLAAAVAVLALVFLGGYLAGNPGKTASGHILQLSGTPAAPHAIASLQIEPKDAAGNWPMKLAVEGLPALPAQSYYEVYLVRDGKPWASCGEFVVARGSRGTTVQLNAPYRLKPGDTWIVTRQGSAAAAPGQVVLRPT